MKTRELLIVPLILILSVEVLHADSATWNLTPGSDDWNTATNWTPAVVPNGLEDTATFGLSNITSVVDASATQLDGIAFNSDASAFTITSDSPELTLSGAGITNNSGIGQNFVVNGNSTMNFTGGAKAGIQTLFISDVDMSRNGGLIQFFGNSTADSGTFTVRGFWIRQPGAAVGFFDNSTAGNATFTNHGGCCHEGPSGLTFFRDNSTAGNGTFTNLAGNGSEFKESKVNIGVGSTGLGGVTSFGDHSSAANGTFTNNGGATGYQGGGGTEFRDAATAENGIFINSGGIDNGGAGYTNFFGSSTAGNGTFTNSGGYTEFQAASSGGTARIKLFDTGSLSIVYHNNPGMTIGSVEGDGNVFLGRNRLTVGSNDLSTTFSGNVQGSGSLEKIGIGTLTFSSANSYTGGTLISSGTLEVTHDGGLGTGQVIVTTLGATLRLQDGVANNYIGDSAVFSIVSSSTVELNFDGTPDTVLALVVDDVVQPAGLYGSPASGAPHQLPEFIGPGKILVATATTPTPTPVPTPTPTPATLLAHSTNLSTRLLAGHGTQRAIAGFIVTGSSPRHLLLRGIGPSLSGIIASALADPYLEVDQGQLVIGDNSNWRDTQEDEIIATGRPPGNDLESALVGDFAPGAYTASLYDGSSTGVGLVEIYDLSTNQDSRLSNISTRGNVGTGNDIMIGGFILGGTIGEDQLILRGIGPSLSSLGISALPDPKLELRDSQGALIASNDNWMDDPNQAAIIQAAGLAPSNNLESAIAAQLLPGAYTALLSGVNNGTGVGLVEVYDLGAPSP